MIRTHGLTHISLSVADLDVALAFYQQLFGVRECFRSETTVQVLGPGPHDVLVFEKRSGRERGSIDHFGFRLVVPEEIGAAREAAVAAGGTVLREGEHAPGEPYLYVEDPDGHEIEIWYERTPPLPGESE